MKLARSSMIASAVLSPLVLVVLAGACGTKDGDGDGAQPTGSASVALPPTSAPPATTTVLAPEAPDAGPDVADAAADADGGKAVGSFDRTGLKKCCSALRNNAKTAPIDQQTLLLGAAGVCDGVVANATSRDALAQVRGMLKAAKVPAECL